MDSIKQNIMSVYNNEIPSKAPVGIYSRYFPRGGMERCIRNMGAGIIEYYPVVSMIGPPWHLKDGFLSQVKNTEIQVHYYWNNKTLLERRIYKTPVGSIFQEIEKDKAGVGSEFIRKHYITQLSDYNIMKYIVDNTILSNNGNKLREIKEQLGEDGIVLGRMDRTPYQKCLIEWAGPERFLVDLYTEPGPVRDLMISIEKRLDESYEMALETDIELMWQPDNVTSDMTPPNAFREYLLPLYKKYSKQVKEKNKRFVVHLDGKIKQLNSLLNEAGIDVIESMSLPEIGGDLLLSEAYIDFPNSVIIPNFPSNWCVLPEKKIIEKLKILLSDRTDKRPFMLQVSEDIPDNEWKRILPIIMEEIN